MRWCYASEEGRLRRINENNAIYKSELIQEFILCNTSSTWHFQASFMCLHLSSSSIWLSRVRILLAKLPSGPLCAAPVSTCCQQEGAPRPGGDGTGSSCC